LSGLNNAKVDSMSLNCFDFFFATFAVRPFNGRTVVLCSSSHS
jgi:hypothetical protein